MDAFAISLESIVYFRGYEHAQHDNIHIYRFQVVLGQEKYDFISLSP